MVKFHIRTHSFTFPLCKAIYIAHCRAPLSNWRIACLQSAHFVPSRHIFYKNITLFPRKWIESGFFLIRSSYANWSRMLKNFAFFFTRYMKKNCHFHPYFRWKMWLAYWLAAPKDEFDWKTSFFIRNILLPEENIGVIIETKSYSHPKQTIHCIVYNVIIIYHIEKDRFFGFFFVTGTFGCQDPN